MESHSLEGSCHRGLQYKSEELGVIGLIGLGGNQEKTG